jgi:hypothetical protein
MASDDEQAFAPLRATRPSAVATVLLRVDAIQPSARNPRQVFNEESLRQLADSIRRWGQLQPVLVRPIGEERYELICGERRWRAHVFAGIDSIWAVVRQADDAEIVALMLTENLNRVDLSHAEKIVAVDQITELAEGKGLRKTANLLRVDPGWLSRQLAIRRDPIIFPAVEVGKIGFGQGAELLQAAPAARRELLDRVLSSPRHVSIATIRAWVKESRQTRSEGTKADHEDRTAHLPDAGPAAPLEPTATDKQDPYRRMLDDLEALGAPTRIDQCRTLFELLIRARELMVAAEQSLGSIVLKQQKTWLDLSCVMCGEQAGLLEMRSKIRVAPGARVRQTKNRLVCGRCGGMLSTALSRGPAGDVLERQLDSKIAESLLDAFKK